MIIDDQKIDEMIKGAQNVLNFILHRIQESDIKYIKIETRIKEKEKIKEKLRIPGREEKIAQIIKKEPKFSELILDFIGIRIIVKEDIPNLYEEVKKFLLHICKNNEEEIKRMYRSSEVKDYIENPKKTGYKAIHIFLNNIYDFNIGIEVQVMTPSMAEFADRTHEEYKDQRYIEVRSGEKAK